MGKQSETTKKVLPENVTTTSAQGRRGAAFQELNSSLTIALSHLIETSTPFRDTSNVSSIPKGHCPCKTN